MKKVLVNSIKLFSVVILIVVMNIILNSNIFITKYQVNSQKIPINFDGYKIIQLTDIHSIRTEKQKEKIIGKVKKINPDCIFVTGDLIDAEYYIEQNEMFSAKKLDIPDKLTVEFMKELTEIATVYWIYGNHEMMLLDNPENNVFKTALEEVGVKLLNNKIDFIKINEQTIKIVGIQDPATLYKDKKYAFVGNSNKDKVKQILEDLFYNENNDLFTMLISHRPEYFDLYSEYDINVVFSGHTHGGIVRLPIIGGLYAHPQGWFPKYTSGLYKNNKLQMIVGRGVGYSQLPIRVFNPPEIVLVILKNVT